MRCAVNLSTDMAASLRTQLVNDAAFLESQGVIDYSLLIGIHEGVEHGRDEWVNKNEPELKRLFELCRNAKGVGTVKTRGRGGSTGGNESEGEDEYAAQQATRLRMFDQVTVNVSTPPLVHSSSVVHSPLLQPCTPAHSLTYNRVTLLLVFLTLFLFRQCPFEDFAKFAHEFTTHSSYDDGTDGGLRELSPGVNMYQTYEGGTQSYEIVGAQERVGNHVYFFGIIDMLVGTFCNRRAVIGVL
jgi:hypothetical protein